MPEENVEERLREFERSMRRSLKIEDINNMWIEYDRQTDTLYIYFGKEEAEESFMLEDNIIVLVKDDKLLGVIINDFSSRYM
jgi:uncharacterized protein YuzE